MQALKAQIQIRELLNEAYSALRPQPIVPKTPHDRIMYDAGIQFALAWLEEKSARSGGETVVKSVAREDLPSFSEATLRNAFGGKHAL